MVTVTIYAFIFLMSSSQAMKNITEEQAETIQTASLYAPPYEQPVKKKKIFFIAGLDPKDNEK